MPTILNTLDLLYIVLAIAIIWVAVFLAWALYEAARFFRQLNTVTSQTRATVGKVQEFVQNSIPGLAMQGGKALVGYLKKKKKR